MKRNPFFDADMAKEIDYTQATLQQLEFKRKTENRLMTGGSYSMTTTGIMKLFVGPERFLVTRSGEINFKEIRK